MVRQTGERRNEGGERRDEGGKREEVIITARPATNCCKQVDVRKVIGRWYVRTPVLVIAAVDWMEFYRCCSSKLNLSTRILFQQPKKMISRESVSWQHLMNIDEQWEC